MEGNTYDVVSADVNFTFGFLYSVDMDSVADIAEIHAIFAFRVRLSSVGECS